MTEQPTATEEQAPEEQATEPPPQPTQQAVVESTYSADDLAASAQELGCYPWDVPAIFKAKGVTEMTIPEFEAALAEWRTPIPPPESQTQSEGGF